MRNFGFAGYDTVIHPGTDGKVVETCVAMGIANLDKIDASRPMSAITTPILKGLPSYPACGWERRATGARTAFIAGCERLLSSPR
jgi:hypothetical protein